MTIAVDLGRKATKQTDKINKQSILKVIQAFHTVRIDLYIGCSGPVVECLNKVNMLQSTTRPLGQNTRYTELCVQNEKLE